MTAKKLLLGRDYDFTDALLQRLAGYTALLITRDLPSLASRGVTAATVEHLEELRNAVINLPTDGEARAMVSDAVEDKDAARGAALVEARRLRTAAQNTFGENSGKYNLFRFERMDKLRDDALPRALRAMHRTGVELQPQLAAEGIDAPFLAAFAQAIALVDARLEEVTIAEQQRDKLTDERIDRGNILYKEIVRLCNIGKDVFATISAATYNCYVIENYVGTGSESIPAATIIIRGKMTGKGYSVVGATVSISLPGEPAMTTSTDLRGRYKFRKDNMQISPFMMTLTADAPGFQHFEKTFQVESGEIYIENVQMAVAMQMVA